MEAFFRNDQEIRESVDLFIEKLFTVNLLAGSEADAEFYQGRQAVEKIASSFQEMFDLPKEILIDGIRQLVEQRLPDHRVIENFPDFYRLMNDMINSGLQNMASTKEEQYPQQIAVLKNLVSTESFSDVPGPSSKISISSNSLRQHLLKVMDNQVLPCSIENKPEESPPVVKAQNELIDESMKQFLQESNIEIDQYSLLEDLVKEAPSIVIEESQEIIKEVEEIIKEVEEILEVEENIEEAVPALSTAPIRIERDPFRLNKRKKVEKSEVAQSFIQGTKPIVTPEPIPQGGQALALVLKQLYSDSLIQWNIAIEQNSFFAKVNNLLIRVVPNDLDTLGDAYKAVDSKMKKSGYSVFTCRVEDLSFPRRLERGIRRVRN